MDVELLRGLPAVERDRVVAHCPRLTYPRGATLFTAGDPAEDLLLIVAGRVAIRAGTTAGETATFAVLGPGQAFGELALLGRGRRTATAVALEPLEVLSMSRATFEELRHRYPPVEQLLVEVLASRVERLSDHLVEALFVPVEQRVVRRLVVLARAYAAGGSDAVVTLTQDDLAGLAGTTRPTVNQVLKQLEADGLVAVRRGRVEVLDQAGLQRRAR